MRVKTMANEGKKSQIYTVKFAEVQPYYEQALKIYGTLKDKESLLPQEKQALRQVLNVLKYVHRISMEKLSGDIVAERGNEFISNIERINSDIQNDIAAVESEINECQAQINSLSASIQSLLNIKTGNSKRVQLRNDLINSNNDSLRSAKKILESLLAEKSELETRLNANMELLNSFKSNPSKYVEGIVDRFTSPQLLLKEFFETRLSQIGDVGRVFNQPNFRNNKYVFGEDGTFDRHFLELEMMFLMDRENPIVSAIQSLHFCEMFRNNIRSSLDKIQAFSTEFSDRTFELLSLNHNYTLLSEENARHGSLYHKIHGDDINREYQMFDTVSQKEDSSKRYVSDVIMQLRYIEDEGFKNKFNKDFGVDLDSIIMLWENDFKEHLKQIEKIYAKLVDMVQNQPEEFNNFISECCEKIQVELSDVTTKCSNIESKIPEEYRGYRYSDFRTLEYWYTSGRIIGKGAAPGEYVVKDKYEQLPYLQAIQLFTEVFMLDDLLKSKNITLPLGINTELSDMINSVMNNDIQSAGRKIA